MLINKQKIIVITGAESTGKSTLAQGLSDYFQVPWIPEAARGYIENLGRNYTYNDVEQIAHLQTKQLNACKTSGVPLIFADTWLIITKVWFDVVFKKTPGWLEKTIVSTPVDLFLVCDTDIPWIPDPVRENGGEKRLMLHRRYLAEIQKYKYKYRIIGGVNEKRLEAAIYEVKQLLGKNHE